LTAPLAPLPLEPLHERAEHSDALPGGAWWAWYGVGGGAGVTTLGQAIAGGHDVEREWPTDRSWPLVVVARGDARGLKAAQQVAMRTADESEWAGQRVLGLVVVADQPRRLPRALVDLGRLVSGGYERVWQVPYVEQWRLGEEPSPKTLPRALRRLGADLYEMCGVPAAKRPGAVTNEQQPTDNRRINP
jgi:hypothetical protein